MANHWARRENTHGVFLYDETLHVPLLIKLPLNRCAASSPCTAAFFSACTSWG